MNATRLNYLRLEIAHYTNPPAHVDATWAARIVADATSEIANRYSSSLTIADECPPPQRTDAERRLLTAEAARFGRRYRGAR